MTPEYEFTLVQVRADAEQAIRAIEQLREEIEEMFWSEFYTIALGEPEWEIFQ